MEREEIFRLQLERRKRDPAGFDLPRLAKAAEAYSGAEIEASVVGALYRAYAAGRDLTTDDVFAELAATSPLSRTRAEDVAGAGLGRGPRHARLLMPRRRPTGRSMR